MTRQLETLSVRAIEPGDLRRICMFLDAEMRQGGWERGPDENLLRWKFFGGPVPAACHAAFDGEGYVVGFAGSVGRRMYIDGREYPVTEATDTFIARPYWGLTTVQALHDKTVESNERMGCALRYGRPNATALRTSLMLGYQRLGTTVRLTRPLSATLLRTRLPAAVVAALRPPVALGSWLWLLPARVAAKLSLRVETVARFDERVERLWRSVRDRHEAVIVRDEAYMNWRYVDSPLSYVCVGAFRGEDLAGVAVGRVCGSVMHVADVLTDNAFVGYLLLGRLLHAAGRRGCVAAHAERAGAACAHDGDPVLTALRAHGFGLKRVVGATIVRQFANAPEVHAMIESGGWAYRGGDSDQS